MGLLITLLIIVLVVAIVWWILQQIPIPAPFRWIVNVVIGVIALLVVLEYVAPMLKSVQ